MPDEQAYHERDDLQDDDGLDHVSDGQADLLTEVCRLEDIVGGRGECERCHEGEKDLEGRRDGDVGLSLHGEDDTERRAGDRRGHHQGDEGRDRQIEQLRYAPSDQRPDQQGGDEDQQNQPEPFQHRTQHGDGC